MEGTNMATCEPKLITAGVIAERLGVSVHRVQHILRTRPNIRPAARAGSLRVYSADAVQRVACELASMSGWEGGE